jgi:hypothetical protein
MSRVEQIADKLGIEIVSMSHDEVVGTMPVAGNRQPFGLLHGGASGVLAETLGSTLAALHSLPERFPSVSSWPAPTTGRRRPGWSPGWPGRCTSGGARRRRRS